MAGDRDPATGQFVKGVVPHNKTKHIDKTCPACGKAFSVRPSWARVVMCSRSCAGRGRPSNFKGHSHSPEAKELLRAGQLGRRGPDHWNWRGAARSERKRAMSRDEYVQWRTAVFERDNYTCQFCGARCTKLHADHIEPWATAPALRFEVSNGRTLCVPCHWQTPSFPKQLIPREMRCE